MSSLPSFSINKVMVITNLRNVDGYENMFRQQLEDIVTTPSAYRPTLFETRNSSPRFRPRTKTRSLYPSVFQELGAHLNPFQSM